MILVKGLQKYKRSKLEFGKNICQLCWPRVHGLEPGRWADIFFELQLWLMVTLQPLYKNGCIEPHLKDLFNICLEPEVQVQSMTYKAHNVGSKYLYFTPYKGKSITLTEQNCTIRNIFSWFNENLKSFNSILKKVYGKVFPFRLLRKEFSINLNVKIIFLYPCSLNFEW